jgi:hypothetical protein
VVGTTVGSREVPGRKGLRKEMMMMMMMMMIMIMSTDKKMETCRYVLHET